LSGFLRALLGLDLEPTPAEAGVDRHLVAAAALMVEAARLDGQFGQPERQRMLELLTQHFRLAPEIASHLLAEAESHAEESVDWHGFTTAVKEGFDHEGRLGLVQMLWEIVYADGRLHDYEASLLRRVAGLLYVSGGESAEARQRALARLGLPPDPRSMGTDGPAP
jgi:uncharacterized tellurite resistance protein B-like protein